MKHISIALILACVLVTTATGCSLFKSGTENTNISTPTPISNNNGNIVTYNKEDIYIDLFQNDALAISLTPTDNAQAGITYMVDLYEKGVYRASSIVEWNQPELNIKLPLVIYFPLSHEEWHVYIQCFSAHGCYLSDTFSVSGHN
jgi:hypothetical protein